MPSERIIPTVVPPGLALDGATIFASQGAVYALDAATGALLRSYAARGVSGNPVAVGAGTLYVNLNYIDEHAVLAMRADDGTPIWRHDTAEGVSRSPTVAAGVVYANTTGGHVLALATSAGALLWEYGAGPILFDRPIVADDTLYCSAAVNQPDTSIVLALDARTGTHRWSAPIPESTSHALCVADGRVDIAAHRGCHARDAASGAPRWHHAFPAEDFLTSSPVVAGDVVYGTLTRSWPDHGPDPMDFSSHIQRSEAAVYALRAADGALLWCRALTTGDASAAPTAPVVAGDRVYAGTGDGVLHALAAADGTTVWHYQTAGRMLSTPIMTDNTICTGASDGYVYGLDAHDGALRWRTFTSTSVSVAVGIRIHSFTVEPHQPPGEG